MTGTIRIDFACNDPDNGNFVGKAQGITFEIPDVLTELEPRRWGRPPTFKETPKGFKLAGKNWEAIGSVDWIGNWCWNGYTLELPTAVRFLNWLRRRRLFDCTTGVAEFHDWFNAKPLTPDLSTENFAVMLDLETKPKAVTAA